MAGAAEAAGVAGKLSLGSRQEPVVWGLQGSGGNEPCVGGAPSALYRMHSSADPEEDAGDTAELPGPLATAASPGLEEGARGGAGASGKSGKVAALAPATRCFQEL